MIYAKIVNGAIVSREAKTNPTSNTAADGGPTWRPIEETAKPAYDAVTQSLVRSETIETARVLISWAAQDKSLDDAKAARTAAINAEAGAKIVAVMPEYKQRNALALGLDLTTTHGADPNAWPAEAKAVYDAFAALWAQISAIRAASDTAVASVQAAASVSDVRAVTASWPNA
jgi:hypothetical protein